MPAVSALPATTRPSAAGSTESSRPSTGLAILLTLLGLGAMTTALLVPLALGWIDYHVAPGAAEQLRGGDVAGLVLAGPVALAAAWHLAPIQAIADSLLSIRDHAPLAAVFAFNVGALSYYALFYRSRLVPWWLSGWGMTGVVLLMTACLLALFSDNPVTGYTLLILPIALHERALAVWLSVKGFGPASHPSSSARKESTARGQLLPPTARPKSASTAFPTSVTMWP
jgi:Domain of unknown function (DUF4386)